MAANGQGPAWTITGQREDYRPGPSGPFVEGVVVTFRTAAGHVGSVFIPKAQYVEATVRASVDAQARMMDQVGSMQG